MPLTEARENVNYSYCIRSLGDRIRRTGFYPIEGKVVVADANEATRIVTKDGRHWPCFSKSSSMSRKPAKHPITTPLGLLQVRGWVLDATVLWLGGGELGVPHLKTISSYPPFC